MKKQAVLFFLITTIALGCNTDEFGGEQSLATEDIGSTQEELFVPYYATFFSWNECPKGGYIVSYGQPAPFVHEFRAVGIILRGQEHRFRIPLQSGSKDVFIWIDGTGDADLYAGIGTSPSVYKYDCRPYLTGTNEFCEFDYVNDELYIMVRGWDHESKYRLSVSWEEQPQHWK